MPGSILKILTAMGGLDSGALTAATKFPQQPGAEKNGLVVSGFTIKDGHHQFTGHKVLDLLDATEVSCNIYYAMPALKDGGGADAMARRLGFYAPLPFDLPTATSQLTNAAAAAGRLPRRRARQRRLRWATLVTASRWPSSPRPSRTAVYS